MRWRGSWLWLGLGLLWVSGCEVPMEHEPLAELEGPLTGYCTADVIGVGSLEIEGDYLAHVVQCENGNAPLEALKAQAVAARSYLYYKLNTSGSIADGQSDQVYSCGASPTSIHYQAVSETAGQVILYNNTQIAAFYVAGAYPSADSCIASWSNSDPHNTEHYVTYNWENYGAGVEQTTLGWVHPENYANRGCMSQNGASCLADQGWVYSDILKFYYGMDFALVTAEANCIDSCTPGCNGDSVVGADCVETPCEYGAACVDDANGPRCVMEPCPSFGSVSLCKDETTIWRCENGTPDEVVDCGVADKICVEVGSDWAICVDSPCQMEGMDLQPGASICKNEVVFTCELDGGVVMTPCPAGESCNDCGECGPLPTEVCDGVDNNCDGEIDEGFGIGGNCMVGEGFCGAPGEIGCDESGEAVCLGEPYGCDDDDSCTEDSCDPSFGCRNEVIDPFCNWDWFSRDNGETAQPDGENSDVASEGGCRLHRGPLRELPAGLFIFLFLLIWRLRRPSSC